MSNRFPLAIILIVVAVVLSTMTPWYIEVLAVCGVAAIAWIDRTLPA